jgi:hypothetical protein
MDDSVLKYLFSDRLGVTEGSDMLLDEEVYFTRRLFSPKTSIRSSSRENYSGFVLPKEEEEKMPWLVFLEEGC